MKVNWHTETWKFATLVIFLVLCAIPIPKHAGAQALPEHIRTLVWSYLRFADPVTTAILESDFTVSRLQNNLWAAGYLIPQGYLRLGKDDTGAWRYFIEQKLRPSMTVVKGWPSNWIKIAVASRTLKKIDYVKRRTLQLPMTGEKTDAWSFTFTYLIKPLLPGLPQMGPLTGEATTILDPKDGKWKVVNASLSECSTINLWDQTRSTCVYDSLLTQWQQRAVTQRQDTFRVGNLRQAALTYNDGKPRGLVFYFDIEGGKPPIKVDTVLFNNESIQDVFKKTFNIYRVVRDSGMSRSKENLFGGEIARIKEDAPGFATGSFSVWMNMIQDRPWDFGWPEEITAPLKVKAVIMDSSSPPKRESMEMEISSLPRLKVDEKRFPGPGGLGSYVYYVERSGHRYIPGQPPSELGLDLSGTWIGEYRERNPFNGKETVTPFRTEFQQRESKLTGEYIAEGVGRYSLTGIARGGEATMAFDFKPSGKDYSFHYDGKVSTDGKSIEGRWNYGPYGNGTWILRR